MRYIKIVSTLALYTILNAVNGNGNKCFFIDGPGGSGKSYILNILIAYFEDNKINVLPVA